MKNLRHLIAIATLLAAFTPSAFSQEPDRWKGMILDQTTAEQALAAFGKPKSDKLNQKFRPLKYDEWFDVKSQNFRELHFESISGFLDVKLYFRDDKLVAINLEPKDLKASLVSQSYQREFEIIFDGLSPGPRTYSTDTRANHPRSFPSTYYLMNKADRSYIFVYVDNTSFRGLIAPLIVGGVEDVNSVPGKARIIQLVSKNIGNTQGSDLLK